MDLVIRRAKKEDQERLGTFWLALHQEQAALETRVGVADDALERWANDFPHWLDGESRRFFVAEQSDKIVGFLTAQVWSPPPIYAEVLEVYISELYVVPEARKQHTGVELVAAVRGWAETLGASRLRIGVLAVNAPGKEFWQQQQAQPFSITYMIPLAQAKPVTIPKPRRIGF